MRSLNHIYKYPEMFFVLLVDQISIKGNQQLEKHLDEMNIIMILNDLNSLLIVDKLPY